MDNNKTKKQSNWITQKELAKERQVRISCVNNWVSRGKVQFKEVYGKILVNRNTVTARTYNKN